MTGDRRLEPHEMKRFLQHQGTIGFDTIKETLFTGGEPTLFDVAFIEIIAKLDAHTEQLINQGAEIKALGTISSLIRTHNARLNEFNTKINEFERGLEDLKKFLTDQIEELQGFMEEIKRREYEESEKERRD